jgi:hypothetical protein
MNPPMPRFISPRQVQKTALSAFGLGELMAKWRKRAKELNDAAATAGGNTSLVLKAQAKQTLDCLYELKAESEKQ